MPAKYDGSVLAPGFYDLNNDGVIDTLAFLYKGKHALFISDDGKLPWACEPEEGFDLDEDFDLDGLEGEDDL